MPPATCLSRRRCRSLPASNKFAPSKPTRKGISWQCWILAAARTLRPVQPSIRREIRSSWGQPLRRVFAAGIQVSSNVALDELVSFYGVGLGPANALGVQILNGSLTNSLAAPLLYAGPDQISAIERYGQRPNCYVQRNADRPYTFGGSFEAGSFPRWSAMLVGGWNSEPRAPPQF